MNARRLFIALALVAWACTAAAAKDVKVFASVSKRIVAQGETFELSITVKGARQSGRPLLPAMKSFTVLRGPAEQQNMSIVNGRMSVSVTYTYVLRPRSLGEHVIPAVKLYLGGKQYATAPITVKVIKSKGKNSKTLTIDDAAFAELVPDKIEAYMYEQIVLSVKLYHYKTCKLSRVSPTVLSSGKSFLEEDLGMNMPQKESQTTRNGMVFNVIEIPIKALFPVVVGKVTIPEARFTGTLHVPHSRSRRPHGLFDTPFDDFFDNPFGMGNYRAYTVTMVTPPVTINVKPLPEKGRPADFNDVVGSYDFAANVKPNKVNVGDGITLTMIISGRGNIKTVGEPQLESHDGFKLYRSEVASETVRKRGVIGGRKVFKKIIEPQSDKIKQVPAVRFAFFDPRTSRYTTLRRGPFPITVEPRNVEKPIQIAPIVISGDSKRGVVIQKQDILPIMTSYSSFSNEARPAYQSPMALGLVIAPPVLLLASLLVQRRRERLITDRGYARQRRAYAEAKRNLAEAKRAIEQSNQRQAYALLAHAMATFIADKLDLPPASVSALTAPDLLAQAGVNSETIAETTAALETCDHARFSSEAKPQHQIQSDYDKAVALIKALERRL